MPVKFAQVYLDRLFADADLLGLHHLLSVIEQEIALPEPLWLSCRLLEWVGSTRSGSWQYYEGIPAEKYDKIWRALENFGLHLYAEIYRSGRVKAASADRGVAFDRWLDSHEDQINRLVLDLALREREWVNSAASGR